MKRSNLKYYAGEFKINAACAESDLVVESSIYATLIVCAISCAISVSSNGLMI